VSSLYLLPETGKRETSFLLQLFFSLDQVKKGVPKNEGRKREVTSRLRLNSLFVFDIIERKKKGYREGGKGGRLRRAVH